MKASTFGFLAALALLTGCGTRPTDYPLATGQANQTQPPLDADPDHPFVVLTFSGGGSRAAALAAAVVEQLNHLHYTVGGETRSLAADIAVVSSVSGGSVYAADLALNGPGHAPSFMRRIQDYDGIGWLTRRALNPFTWLSLQFQGETRINLQQEMLEDLLETNATLGAINQPGKPLTLLNATDLIAGQVFTFDRQTLDDVCMDYDRIPISLGVNASAAVPIAYTPVLLRDDSYLASAARDDAMLTCHIARRCSCRAARIRIWKSTALRDTGNRCAMRPCPRRVRVTRFRPIEHRSICVLSMAALRTTRDSPQFDVHFCRSARRPTSAA